MSTADITSEAIAAGNMETAPLLPAVSAATKPAVTESAPKTSVFDFLRQVRNEASRVTWPTRNETIVTTIMVFIMVTLAALFFLAADQILSRGVALILGVFGR